MPVGQRKEGKTDMTENEKTPQVEKMSYSVREIQVMLGISRCKAYRLIRENKFRTIQIGRTYKVIKQSFDEWFQTEKGVS